MSEPGVYHLSAALRLGATFPDYTSTVRAYVDVQQLDFPGLPYYGHADIWFRNGDWKLEALELDLVPEQGRRLLEAAEALLAPGLEIKPHFDTSDSWGALHIRLDQEKLDRTRDLSCAATGFEGRDVAVLHRFLRELAEIGGSPAFGELLAGFEDFRSDAAGSPHQ